MNKRFLSSPERPEGFWNPPCILFNMRRSSIPKEKRLRRESDLPAPFSTKNNRSYTFAALIRLSKVYGRVSPFSLNI